MLNNNLGVGTTRCLESTLLQIQEKEDDEDGDDEGRREAERWLEEV